MCRNKTENWTLCGQYGHFGPQTHLFPCHTGSHNQDSVDIQKEEEVSELVVSSYHSAVQRAIGRYGKSLRKVRRVRGPGRPLHVNHPTKNKVLSYEPDVYFELKNRTVVVFEVLDSQSSDKTIADLVRSLLCLEVCKVFFIVPDDRARDEVNRICDVVLSKIADDFEKRKCDLLLEPEVVIVTRDAASRPRDLAGVLLGLLDI